ncbi:MAG: tetratricopeptide repeat protein [Ferruginibacter sp.]|nr:tetratricopeptide repeat protein [Ferruginibacter sp.]
MEIDPFKEEREELKELLKTYANLKNGRGGGFLEEEGFERIIEYYDERMENLLALEAAELATAQYRFSSHLLNLKSGILISLRRYEEALSVLEQSAIMDPNDVELYILRTDAFLALDRQEEAAFLLEEAVERFGGEERIELLFELSDVYDDYENFEKVFDCLKLILEQDGNNEEALYKICFWTDYTGRNEESIKLHRQIIDENPYNELAWFNLGAAYQGLNLYEKAIDAYLYAVAIDEKFDFAYRNMGDAYIRLRNFKDAIEVLEKVIELTHPESVIYEAIGHCHDKMENFAQARFHYKKASHLSPEEAHLHYKVACSYMNEGNFSMGVKNLEQAIKINAHHPEYFLAMGRCFYGMKNHEEAVRYFGIAVSMRPKNITGWTELLTTLYQSGLVEDALDYAHLAYIHTDKKPLFLYYISMFMLESGKPKEGLSQLENALQINIKQLKKFIDINPAILQNQQVVELIARYKRNKR